MASMLVYGGVEEREDRVGILARTNEGRHRDERRPAGLQLLWPARQGWARDAARRSAGRHRQRMAHNPHDPGVPREQSAIQGGSELTATGSWPSATPAGGSSSRTRPHTIGRGSATKSYANGGMTSTGDGSFADGAARCKSAGNISTTSAATWTKPCRLYNSTNSKKKRHEHFRSTGRANSPSATTGGPAAAAEPLAANHLHSPGEAHAGRRPCRRPQRRMAKGKPINSPPPAARPPLS